VTPAEQHRQLVDIATEAINDVFGHTAVSRETTRASLAELRERADELIQTMDDEDAGD